jgi:hypothetical protein
MQLNVLVGAFVLLLAACAPQTAEYEVAVSGLKDATMSRPPSYVILPGIEGVDTADLQYLEVKRYLRPALESQGMREATVPHEADVVVFVGYGIGEPKTYNYAYSLPVYGQISGGTTTYSGTAYGPGGTVTSRGTATTQPTHGVVGSRNVVDSRTTYSRFISLAAVDLQHYRKTQVVRQAWTTAVVSVGSSGDLRHIIPVMLAAATPYLGTDTKETLFIRLKEGDPRITEVRNRGVVK